MKLTCVTATFNCIKAGNRERLIRCVESVANLKTEHEHLIYDGASTDGTVELLRELEAKTPGLKVVSEPDAGIYNALNKGVRNAKGEWFYVLGCDDEILKPDIVGSLITEGDCANAGMVAAPVFTSYDGRSILKIFKSRLIGGGAYPHQGLLMRTELIIALGGFDESYRLAADYELILKAICLNKPIIVTQSAFSYYDTHGASSDELLCGAEFERVISSVFGIPLSEAHQVRIRAPRSTHFVLRCLVHTSRNVRIAGWYLLLRLLLNKFGFLNAEGALRWRK